MYQQKAASIDQFEILTRLGEGSFGSVYKIKRIDDQKFYAMKKVKMQKLSAKEKENALNEIRILASVQSQYIVAYKDAFYNESSGELCIVMEYADKGDLQGLITRTKNGGKFVEEKTIWMYAAQMIMGLKSLHDMNILHRDLKGANVFLSENGQQVKLGDLNVSKVAKKNFVYTQTGTPYYLSPEVWRGEAYNHKCDVWSLGCVVYELSALNPPFTATTLEELYKKVLKGNYQKVPDRYSQDLHKFIQMCLILSPKSRPGLQELMEFPAIKPFITIDVQEEKAQLLKTLKLPYGGLNQLKNILPRAQYEESKSQNQQQQVQQPQVQQQQANQNQQDDRGRQAQQQTRPEQKKDRPSSAQGSRVSEQPGYQKPLYHNVQSPQNKAQSEQVQKKQQNQAQQQSPQRVNSAQQQQQSGQQKRSASQERLLSNYNNNQIYNQQYAQNNYQYGSNKGNQQQQQPQSVQKPPIQQQKPPVPVQQQQQNFQKPPAGQNSARKY